MQKVWLLYAGLFAVTLLLLAPLVYLVCYALQDYPLNQALTALAAQYSETRQNPLRVSLLSAVPFLLLAGVVGVARWRDAGVAACRRIVAGGGTGIGVVLAWAHFEFWPNYLPGVEYPGFPHGLELVIAPLFFAPLAMAAGAFLACIPKRAS